MYFFLPSAWLFSLVGTAAVPPVFLAAWWHPSQTAPTLTDQNSHEPQSVEKHPSGVREKANLKPGDLDKLISLRVSVPKLSLTPPSCLRSSNMGFLFLLFCLFWFPFFFPCPFRFFFPLPYSSLTLPVQTGTEEFSLRGRETQRGSKREVAICERKQAKGWKKLKETHSFSQYSLPQLRQLKNKTLHWDKRQKEKEQTESVDVLLTSVLKDVKQKITFLNLAVTKAAVRLSNKQQIKTQTLQVQACAVRLSD